MISFFYDKILKIKLFVLHWGPFHQWHFNIHWIQALWKMLLLQELIERHHFFRKPSFWTDLQHCINHLMGGRVQLQMRKEQQRKGHQGWWTEIKHKILVLLEAIKVKRFTTENNLINCSIIKRMMQIFSVIWFLNI